MSRRGAAALVALLLAAPGAARASTWLKPLLLKRGTYGESLTFVADLDDGGYLQLSIGMTNLGPGSTKGICRGLLVPAAGKPWKASARVGRDEIHWSSGEEERLSLAGCAATVGEAGTTVEVKLEGGTLRVAFAARPRREGQESTVSVEGGRYLSEVLLHRAPLTATVSLPGAAPRTVAGAGYLDHTRSTIAPKDLARRWIRFRGLRGERGLLLLGREGHDGRFGPLWSCTEPGSCRDLLSFRVERQGRGGATAFRVEVASGEGPIELRSARLLYRDDPLEDLGVLGALIAPFTGAPVTYVYRATAQEGLGAPVDGILEVELSGE
ncbi:MAG TPA: hypothetical protein VEM76_08735 [Anaeromyxobacteraceae bacterium]|nr:hypothetical protein [Anaeromyxobacteraceae bacterium]